MERHFLLLISFDHAESSDHVSMVLSVGPAYVLTCNKQMPMHAAEERADETTPGFFLEG